MADAPLVPKDEKGLMDKLVNRNRLKEWPSETLLCARVTRVVVITGVTMAIVGLIISFFAGTHEVTPTTTKVSSLPLPVVVFCPVWGQKGMELNVAGVSAGNLMTQDYSDWKPVKFKAKQCPPFKHYEFKQETPRLVNPSKLDAVNSMTCVCLDTGLELANHNIGKDFIRVAFSASFLFDGVKSASQIFLADGVKDTSQISMGFSSTGEDYPPDWSYLPLKSRSIGEITLADFVYGKTPVTSGTTISHYSFGLKTAYDVPASTFIKGGNTEVVLSYGSYYISETEDMASNWSFFALLVLLSLILALIASCVVFDLFFPAVSDPDDPPQIEPNWIFQELFGSCFKCCRKRQA